MGKFDDYINVTAPLHSATTKGKLGNANEVFTENDEDNVQNVINKTNEHIKKLDNRSSQMEESIKNISVTGGASVAEAVTYDNTTSSLKAVNVKGAIDELDDKNKKQDLEINKKLNKEDSIANKVTYNNKTSSLESENVQEAIDEVDSKVSDLNYYNINSESIIDVIKVEFKATENTTIRRTLNTSSKGLRFLLNLNKPLAATDASNSIAVGFVLTPKNVYKRFVSVDNTRAFIDVGEDIETSNIEITNYNMANKKDLSGTIIVYRRTVSDIVDVITQFTNVQEAIDEVDSKVSDVSKSFPSVFNNGVTFIPLVFAHEFTAINQAINLNLNNLTGNFRLLVIVNEYHLAISVTDNNGIKYLRVPDLSYKNRYAFDLKNVSNLNKIVFGTYGLPEATFKPSVVSAVLYNKNTEDFVDIWNNIDIDKANKSEVDLLVKKIEDKISKIEDKISSNKEPTIECSESFICPVGETIQIFYKSIFNGININDFIISCRSNVGKSYPRYFEYKATELGNKSVTFNLCKFDGYEYKVVSTKSVIIECIQHPKSSSKNILIIGDSITLYNSMQDEILRRINNEGGEPKGYKLTCNFLGRKTTSNGTKFEGISGYSWQKYTTRLGRSFKFTVPSTTNTSVGSKYKVQMNDGSNKNLQVIEVNISNDNTASSYIKLIFDSDYDDLKKNPLANGTLVKISGSGDTSISYTRYEVENYSPFVNNDEVDFKPYFDEYCNGKVDIMIIELGTNDITSLLNKNLNTFDLINDYINLYCEKFISKLHEQYPNTQLVILGLHKCSQNGGMNNVNNSSDKARYCRYLFKWNKALQDIAKKRDYTHYIDVNAQFDSENSYNKNVTKQVNLRNSKVESIDCNSVHPITSGLQLIADSVVRYLCKIL